MSEHTNAERERMYTCVSDLGCLEGLSAEEEVDTSGVRSMLGGDAPQETERNVQSANNEDEDEEDEVFSSENENEMEPQEGRIVKMRTRKRRSPGPGKKPPKFPCGICEEGVGSPGIVCCACGSWIHNGKTKQCAGLSGKVVTHADSFRCPKCLQNNREINLELRDNTIALSKKNTASHDKNNECNSSKNSINRTKRGLQEPSPEKDERGNPCKKQRQRADTEHLMDYSNEAEEWITKLCIDCNQSYAATYDDPILVSCWICGLGCHGCRSHLGTKGKELSMVSKGYTWICLDCKKETQKLKKNQNRAEEVEHLRESVSESIEDAEIITKKPPSGSVNSNASKTNENVNGDDTGRNKNGSMHSKPVAKSTDQQINTLRLNKDALSSTSWLLDSHIQTAIEDIEKYGEGSNGSILYFVPSLTHFIKLATQNDVETQLDQNDATSKSHMIFTVNDGEGGPGSGEGSHWSLLIYERNGNTWYHLDSGGITNAPHAKRIIDKVNKYLVKQGILKNANTDYVACRCTQQRNGHDCGPLAILFAKKINKMIARGESLDTCWVDNTETHSVRRRIHTLLCNKLRHLEKGEFQTSDNIRKSVKDDTEKRKKKEQVCWFYKYRVCKFGKYCSYGHPPRVRREEGDRYRDRLFESRDYGRSVNDRQNDKRVPLDPDEYKHQKYNYGGHQNSRGQRVSSDREQNQNTHFLGYRRNLNYGSAPTSAELRPTAAEKRLLRVLRECVQTKSDSRFPVRR